MLIETEKKYDALNQRQFSEGLAAFPAFQPFTASRGCTAVCEGDTEEQQLQLCCPAFLQLLFRPVCSHTGAPAPALLSPLT